MLRAEIINDFNNDFDDLWQLGVGPEYATKDEIIGALILNASDWMENNHETIYSQDFIRRLEELKQEVLRNG